MAKRLVVAFKVLWNLGLAVKKVQMSRARKENAILTFSA